MHKREKGKISRLTMNQLSVKDLIGEHEDAAFFLLYRIMLGVVVLIMNL